MRVWTSCSLAPPVMLECEDLEIRRGREADRATSRNIYATFLSLAWLHAKATTTVQLRTSDSGSATHGTAPCD